MKTSISTKLLLYMTSVLLLLVVVLFLMNQLLLPRFYVLEKKNVIRTQGEYIKSLDGINYDEYYFEIEDMTKNSGTEIVIYNDDKILYSTFFRPDKSNKVTPDFKGNWWTPPDGVEREDIVDGFFINHKDPANNTESIVYKYKLDDDNIVSIRIITGAIDDSIRITN